MWVQPLNAMAQQLRCTAIVCGRAKVQEGNAVRRHVLRVFSILRSTGTENADGAWVVPRAVPAQRTDCCTCSAQQPSTAAHTNAHPPAAAQRRRSPAPALHTNASRAWGLRSYKEDMTVQFDAMQFCAGPRKTQVRVDQGFSRSVA